MIGDIERGDLVKDVITGYKGIVVAECNSAFNVRRIGMQSQSMKDGVPIDAQWFDENTVVLTKKNVVAAVPLIENNFNYLDEVEDTVTGFKGKVTGVVNWLNGCVKLALIPLELKDGLPQENVDFSAQRLKLISSANPVPAQVEKRGGPMDAKFKNSCPSLKNKRG